MFIAFARHPVIEEWLDFILECLEQFDGIFEGRVSNIDSCDISFFAPSNVLGVGGYSSMCPSGCGA